MNYDCYDCYGNRPIITICPFGSNKLETAFLGTSWFITSLGEMFVMTHKFKHCKFKHWHYNGNNLVAMYDSEYVNVDDIVEVNSCV